MRSILNFKSLASGLFLAFILFTYLCCSQPEKSLIVWTWEGFVTDEMLRKFEASTRIKAKISLISSNADSFNRIAAGAEVDILAVSHNQLLKLLERDLLSPLPQEKLPSFSNLLPQFQHAYWTRWDGSSFGQGNLYAVPFVYGVDALAINSEKIDIPDEGVSFGILWDKRYRKKVATQDGPPVIYKTLMYLGIDPDEFFNNDMPQKSERYYLVKEKAQELKENSLKFWDTGQEAMSLLIQEDVWIEVLWDGHIRKIQAEGYPISLVIPKEGTAIWCDAYVILARSARKEEALKWLNFNLQPEIASEISKSGGFTTCNEKALALLPAELRKKLIYSPEEFSRLRWTENLPLNLERLRVEMWHEILAE
jgi:spermidine/putrescine-binding protein